MVKILKKPSADNNLVANNWPTQQLVQEYLAFWPVERTYISKPAPLCHLYIKKN